MFEQKFLADLIYTSLIEFRAKGIESDDKQLYWLSHLLHNTPQRILNEDDSKKEFERLIRNIHAFELEKWFETKIEDFFISFPEYLPEKSKLF